MRPNRTGRSLKRWIVKVTYPTLTTWSIRVGFEVVGKLSRGHVFLLGEFGKFSLQIDTNRSTLLYVIKCQDVQEKCGFVNYVSNCRFRLGNPTLNLIHQKDPNKLLDAASPIVETKLISAYRIAALNCHSASDRARNLLEQPYWSCVNSMWYLSLDNNRIALYANYA